MFLTLGQVLLIVKPICRRLRGNARLIAREFSHANARIDLGGVETSVDMTLVEQ